MTPAAYRATKAFDKRLVAKGGTIIEVRLTPEAVEALATLTAQNGKSRTANINQALLIAAGQNPKP